MIDEQVDAEELVESRRNRQAAANANDDGMALSGDGDKRLAATKQGGPFRKWLGHIRQWLATQTSSMRP
ncbi:hypothetical protein [Caballeronia sp. LZ019]|uniref:hypothetical protein n=1 Tax=Caballeronia sp. LZ019 TaxID=3038555 RepID=UPI00285CB0E3|nr:hypothetical protein [Caballeronia sp. LZ019]MDR5809823.1 hypothetical protein [Caballeronia sp. LZ019]